LRWAAWPCCPLGRRCCPALGARLGFDGAWAEPMLVLSLLGFACLKREIFLQVNLGSENQTLLQRFFASWINRGGPGGGTASLLPLLIQSRRKEGEALLLGRVVMHPDVNFLTPLPYRIGAEILVSWTVEGLSAHWAAFRQRSAPEALSIAFVPGCIVSTCGSCIWGFAVSVGSGFMCLPWSQVLLKEFHL